MLSKMATEDKIRQKECNFTTNALAKFIIDATHVIGGMMV